MAAPGGDPSAQAIRRWLVRIRGTIGTSRITPPSADGGNAIQFATIVEQAARVPQRSSTCIA